MSTTGIQPMTSPRGAYSPADNDYSDSSTVTEYTTTGNSLAVVSDQQPTQPRGRRGRQQADYDKYIKECNEKIEAVQKQIDRLK